MEEQKRNQFTASLHTHVRSLNDAHIEPKALCARIKELGGKGCAITDHGVLTSIEEYRTVFKDNDLKMIPGCELYVDGGILGRLHLVVLAVNDHGYKGISKIVTESNRNIVSGFPVITQEKLFEMMGEYKGDIFALSACMQGVLSAIFLQNKSIDDKVANLRKKQSSYLAPASSDVIKAEQEAGDAQKALEESTIRRDTVKRLSEQKFAKREREIEKLEKAGQDVTALKEEYDADKAKAMEAVKELPIAKAELNKTKKRVSAANAALKKVEESVSSYMKYEEEINTINQELKSPEELYDTAKNVAQAYVSAFGADCFYAEVQYHGIPEEDICFPKVADLATDLNIPLVATNDVHILNNTEDDRLKRQILRSMRFGKSFEEESVGDSELYLKDDAELSESLLKILPDSIVKEAIENIGVIFDRCNVDFCTEKHYPKFSQTEDADQLLDKAVEEGIKRLYPDGMDEEHKERLAYELPIIKSMGYSDYHLIVKDFLEYARLLGYVPTNLIDSAPLSIEELKSYISENGWTNPGFVTGPGRGSAVGSFVCNLIGITALDPLKYGLRFERYLNPERISMPDIDSDISNAVRSKVIQYIRHKYGENSICGIISVNAQGPKGSLKIAAKFYGYKVYGQPMKTLGDTMSKDVPEEPGVSFSSKVDDNGTTLADFLKQKYSGNADAQEILRWARVIEGSFTAYGTHAAGIVISDNNDVSEYLPLKMNEEMGMFTTQCDKVQVEDLGLLKFDLLGLITLDVITGALRMIEEQHGVLIDPKKLDITDSRVYETILAAGKTNSVFQFESDGMKAMLKRFKPDCFEDLIILVSMFRPGPLQYLNGVIDVKNGVKEATYLTPELEPILGKTYGAIVYQEQVMEICQALAGFTFAHADQVRRFMSKKKADKLAHEREAFVEGCGKKGISEDIANTLFDQMMDFASYAFNKSHAAAYALNAYITSWLKCYYPVEFFASALNWAKDIKEIAGLIHEAKACGVEILAPDINTSERDFSVVDGKVLYGLGYIAGVKSHADEIIKERDKGVYTSLKDFYTRIQPNKTAMEHLISAGAFDAFGTNRMAMKAMIEEMKDVLKKYRDKSSFIKSAEYVLPAIERFKTADEVVKYQTDAGLRAEIDDVTTAARLSTRIENAKNALSTINKELDNIRIREVPEDKTERMALERECVGSYITEHPMDFYPKASDLGLKTVSELGTDAKEAYGVITAFEVRKRKKDGAEMATFEIEDSTGSMNCVIFVQAYGLYKELLAEGRVVRLTGYCKTEEDYEGNLVTQFYADGVESVTPKKSSLVMAVPSLVSFHLDAEAAFREEYEDDKGHPFIIYDCALDEMREMNYRISEHALQLPKVKETF